MGEARPHRQYSSRHLGRLRFWTLVQVTGIGKDYNGLRTLDDFFFQVEEGEIIGPS